MKRLTIILIILCSASLLITALIYFYVNMESQKTIEVEFVKILLQLLLITVIGTFVKIILENYNEKKKKVEALIEKNKAEQREIKLYINELKRSLITSIHNVRRSRSVIIANKSAKSYGEQMKEIMNAKFDINDLKEEIGFSELKIDNKKGLEVKKALNEIENYLSVLVFEYRDNYKRLSEIQIDSPNIIWEEILSLKELNGFLQTDNRGSYHNVLLANYFKVKRLIQNLLLL